MRILSFFKCVLYFLANIWDFKFDFPVPPKYPSRMLKFTFWESMLQIYWKRKKHQKRESVVTKHINDSDIKSFWKEAKFEPPGYAAWLRTAMSKTYGVVVWDKIFRRLASEGESFFEAGCGSGLSSMCLLSFIMEEQLKNDLEARNKIYHGIDLSDARSQLATAYIEEFLCKNNRMGIHTKFGVGDIETIDAEDHTYDVSFIPSVLERVSDTSIEQVVSEVCRITKKYIYVSDFFDHYPDGWPRDHRAQQKIFDRFGFQLIEHRYHMTETIRNQCELQLLFQRTR